MSDKPYKMACSDDNCGWIGDSNKILTAPDPFNPGQDLRACPDCRYQTLHTCCDEPLCYNQDTCGTPTPTGYRRTCGKHVPKLWRSPSPTT